MIKATKEFLAEIDARSEARKKAILETKTEIVPVGRSFYVSNDGDDTNDGTSEKTPLKTIEAGLEKANEPGDVLFLRRGDMWRQHGITLRSKGLTISAYGEGPKPVISNSPFNAADAKYWSLLEGTDNIWVLSEELFDCGSLDFGGGVFAVKEIPDCRNGVFYVRGTEEEFDVRKHLSCDLAFVQPAAKHLTDAGVPWMKLENTDKLYLRCDKGNPGEVFDSIEFLWGVNVFSVATYSVTFDNLCIKHCGAHGIGTGFNFELYIRNCEIGPLGGRIQFYNPQGRVTRFGNGVEIYGGCLDYEVSNCYIHDIYDAGVTHQRSGECAGVDFHFETPYVRPDKPSKKCDMVGTLFMEDIRYKDNLFEHCIYAMEYFCDPTGSYMRDVVMDNNICRFAGGWGWQRPDKVARHIQGGWLHNLTRRYRNENYHITNNIFDRSIDVLLSISSRPEHPEDMPHVMENNIYIQDAGKNFGMCDTPYDKYYPYTEETEVELMQKKRGEKNSKYYIVE